MTASGSLKQWSQGCVLPPELMVIEEKLKTTGEAVWNSCP
jgi:hypothetical protein